MIKLASFLVGAQASLHTLYGLDYKFSGTQASRFGNIVQLSIDREPEPDACSIDATDDDSIVCNIFDGGADPKYEPKDNANRQGGLAYDYDNDVFYWTAKCIDSSETPECTNNEWYLLKSPNPAAGTIDPVCTPEVVATTGFELDDGGSVAYHDGHLYFLAKLKGSYPGAPFQLLALDVANSVVGQACGDAQVQGSTVEVDPFGKAWVFKQGEPATIDVWDLTMGDCGGSGTTAPYTFNLDADAEFGTIDGDIKISLAFVRWLDATDCCNWAEDGLCPNGCADVGSGCDYGLAAVNLGEGIVGFINHAAINFDNDPLDDLYINVACEGDAFTRENGDAFIFTDTARADFVFAYPPEECGEDEFEFDVLGHSGKINIQDGENEAQVTMDFLWERDEDNRKINDPSHSINSFANQEFYWFDREVTTLIEEDDTTRIRFFSCLHAEHDRKTEGLDSKNLNSPQLNEDEMEAFCEDNHGTTAYIAVDIYRFESCLEDVCSGDLAPDVAQGTLKWSVLIRNYQHCNADRKCTAKGQDVIAKYLEFGFQFKADFLADDVGEGTDLELGSGWEMRLDDEIEVNGVVVADSLSDFMEVTAQDGSVLFTIRVEIPAGDTVDVTYDPLLRQSERFHEGAWAFSFQASQPSQPSTGQPSTGQPSTGESQFVFYAIVGGSIVLGVGAIVGVGVVLFRRKARGDQTQEVEEEMDVEVAKPKIKAGGRRNSAIPMLSVQGDGMDHSAAFGDVSEGNLSNLFDEEIPQLEDHHEPEPSSIFLVTDEY